MLPWGSKIRLSTPPFVFVTIETELLFVSHAQMAVPPEINATGVASAGLAIVATNPTTTSAANADLVTFFIGPSSAQSEGVRPASNERLASSARIVRNSTATLSKKPNKKVVCISVSTDFLLLLGTWGSLSLNDERAPLDSVVCGMVRRVDDRHLEGCFRRFQLQSQLLLQRGEE